MVCFVLPSFVSSNLHDLYMSHLLIKFFFLSFTRSSGNRIFQCQIRRGYNISFSLLYHNVLFLIFYGIRIHAWCMDDELVIFLTIFQEFITNSKGVKLFTCRWIPTDCEPKAIVFLNHGYAMECSFSMKGELACLCQYIIFIIIGKRKFIKWIKFFFGKEMN